MHYPPLDCQLIRTETEHLYFGKQLYYFLSLQSTNVTARELCQGGKNSPFIVLAEEQTGGIGRFARTWFSPGFKGIWCSVVFPPEENVGVSGYFNYIISLSVAKSILDCTGIVVIFKWPNDILINGKKVCGILSESRTRSSDNMIMITGAGLNVNIDRHEFTDDIRDKATSLMIESGKYVDRNTLVIHMVQHLNDLYTLWKEDGIDKVYEEWNNRCSTPGQRVAINTEKVRITGTAVKINLDGSLVIECDDGSIHTLYAGDIEYIIR